MISNIVGNPPGMVPILPLPHHTVSHLSVLKLLSKRINVGLRRLSCSAIYIKSLTGRPFCELADTLFMEFFTLLSHL